MEDEYEEDPFDKEIRDNYDLMESAKKIYKSKMEFNDEDREDIEFIIWEDEASEILSDLGADVTIDFDSVPKERLRRIFNKYHNDSITYDDFGNEIDVDPASDFYIGDVPAEIGLHNLGYKLGLNGTIGMYYRLLPNIDFARGWWQGNINRGIKENDESVFEKVKEDIAVYDSKLVEEEFKSAIKDSLNSNVNLNNDIKKK